MRKRAGLAKLPQIVAAGLVMAGVACEQHPSPGGLAVPAQFGSQQAAAQPSSTQLVTPSSPAAKAAGPSPAPATGNAAEAGASLKPAIQYTYKLVNTWPHDTNAFTQGLLFTNGILFEGTGLAGQSTLRRVELATGKVLQHIALRPEYFGEGLALLGGKLFQLTWKHGKGFVYDAETFRLEREFRYEGEGWGLTTDGVHLILSQGTDRIRFLDPATAEVKRTLRVTHQGQPVTQLNELEYVEGEIFANLWPTEFVARIDPATGHVTGIVDFRGLLSPDERQKTDVLNGIAYDAAEKRLFVTGKWWPKLFEVRLEPK